MLIKKSKYIYSIKFCSRNLEYIFPIKTKIRIEEDRNGVCNDFNDDIRFIGNPFSRYFITFEDLFSDSLSKILSAINNINSTNDKMDLQIRKRDRIITAYNLNMASLNLDGESGYAPLYNLSLRADWVVYNFL